MAPAAWFLIRFVLVFMQVHLFLYFFAVSAWQVVWMPKTSAGCRLSSTQDVHREGFGGIVVSEGNCVPIPQSSDSKACNEEGLEAAVLAEEATLLFLHLLT